MIKAASSYIVDLCSLSDTMPDLPENIIPRDNFIKFFEEQLVSNQVLCVDADEGTGVTTSLALFAQYHHFNCISYFNNGLVKALLDPNVMEQSLVRQLQFYIDRTTVLTDSEAKQLSIKDYYIKVVRKLKMSSLPLYFVFDGLQNIPKEAADNIRILMADMPWDKARFIFSGKRDEVKYLFPSNVRMAPDCQLLKFSRYDVHAFLRKMEPDLSDEDCDGLYQISCGKGFVLQTMVQEYEKEKTFKHFLDFDEEKVMNIFEYNFREIESSSKKDNALKVLALVAFSEIKLTRDAICKILDIDIDELNAIENICQNYLSYRDNGIVFSNDSNHKFIRNKLQHLKHDIELLMVQYFETEPNILDFYSYVPALYKSLNDKKGLVAYLNSSTVQKILIQEQSQAALNEQCEYGYNACNLNDSVQAADAFRFALNKSTSREIEKNELWDFQIDAYLSIGDYERAYALSRSIFLKEERLKSLLLIARYRKKIPSEFMEAISNDVDRLVEEIRFEKIPDKSLELARLMFPFKFAAAVQIIERIAKVSKNRSVIDKLYTLLSLTTGNEGLDGNPFNFDVVSSKIEDDELRQMAKAAKTLFEDTNVNHIIAELDNLPSPHQRLYMLRFWIPEHTDTDGIGEIVKYAVNTVIGISNSVVPKASLVKDFCSALSKMNKDDVEQVVMMVDSVRDTVLVPSEDYVRLELLVISSLFKYDACRAGERLTELYFHVSSLANKSTEINCKSIILSQFELLGERNVVEQWLMPSFDLQKEIETDIKTLLCDTAYHINIVREPLASLSFLYPSTVGLILNNINTEERRSKAYCIAASAYLRNAHKGKFNWDYFRGLVEKAKYEELGKSSVVKSFSDYIYHIKEINDEVVSQIKQSYYLFIAIEKSSEKCEALGRLYVWFKMNRPNDAFADKIKTDINQCWENISLPWVRIDIGFLLAKIFAKASQDEAKEMIRRSNKILDGSFLSSSSSVAAYIESLDLYTRSMGLLIRSKLCEDVDIEQYKDILNRLESEGEEIVFWSKIALEYYLVDNTEKFKSVCNKYVVKAVDRFSLFYQKRILFQTSPAFYLYGRSLFYREMERYDDYFVNACIDRVSKFILCKYPYPGDVDFKDGVYELSYHDCECLLDLMEHCTEDSLIFSICDSLCRSLKVNKGGIGTEAKKFIIQKLQELIDKILPIERGIKHDGYKIACNISVWHITTGNQKLTELIDWENKIETITNKADRAFLYIHFAHYVSRGDRRSEYIRKATNIAAGIPSIYDSTNRLDMCISECIDTTKGMAKETIQKAFTGLMSDKSGNLDDFRRLIDIVYQYDPKMARQLIDDLDRDPVRLNYKRQLHDLIQSEQKSEEANKDLNAVRKMNNEEQMSFFSKLLEKQVSGKLTPRDVDDTMAILSKIFDCPLTESKDAVLFFIENIYRKNQINHNHEGLLIKMHKAILFNLKIVLSLSSGTKEKLRRLDLAINEQYRMHGASFMPASESGRTMNFIKEWYRNNPYDNLMIMDAYFGPDQLYAVKELMNLNSNLCVDIVTHRKNVDDISEYQMGWNKISADLTGKITIHSLCYEKNKNLGPLHARWWLSINNDENEKAGIKLTSVSGFDMKDEDIENIEPQKISDIERLFFDYVFFKKRRVNDNNLLYETIELSQPV